jgi:hypothetical protein
MFSEYLPKRVELICWYMVASYMFHILEMSLLWFGQTTDVLTEPKK